jgi:hypothetical protein
VVAVREQPRRKAIDPDASRRASSVLQLKVPSSTIPVTARQPLNDKSSAGTGKLPAALLTSTSTGPTGYATRTRDTSIRHVRPGPLLVLDRLVDVPAQGVSDSAQVLARNAIAEALFGAPVLPGRAGNLIWLLLAETDSRPVPQP